MLWCFTANKIPNINIGINVLVFRIVAVFLIISVSILQFQSNGNMLSCAGASQVSDFSDSFAVNYCLNQYALRLLPPDWTPESGIYNLINYAKNIAN